MDIVVGALSGMVDALPGKLGELLAQEYELLSGARGDVEFLQRELGSMHAAIQHCESLDHPDAQTGAWVGRVRELALDIEDWVDFFAVRVDAGAGDTPPSSSVTAWMRRMTNKITTMPARHSIASELKDLKERVVELSEQRRRYSLGPLPAPAATPPVDPRLAAFYADTGLVGLDAPVEEVARMVTDSSDMTKLKIVSIAGMAGSGKTTLAHAVYRRLEAQDIFDCRAFVSVGQKPETINKVLMEMLSKLGHGHRGGEDIGQLIGRLREFLKNKRYLIVVDDLWSREHWATIKCCFPENNLGSRIITTTRKGTLATECSSGSGECIYKIGFLSDADAEKLFLEKAFGNGHGCPQHLKDVFARLITKCGGLPLAVATRAGMLAYNQSRDDWERLGLGSLSASRSDGVKQILNLSSDGVKQILNLSYNDLPPHVRTCLLYLSIFPENEVDTERLVRQWIAEGFISGTRGVSMEETARSYLNELISRNLVQIVHLDYDGVPRRCRVHPVIHDFIVCKSMEENFATVVDAEQQHVPTHSSTIRRLSLQNSIKKDHPMVRNESMDLSHARSITVLGHASAMPQLTDLKVVRVLDLEGCNGLACLDGLCKLLLLRYLSLKGTDVSELPEQIGELRCLETLDVRSTNVKVLPPSIDKLEKLMHLLAGKAKLPGGIAKMKALQTLSCSANTVEQLSQFDSLRELELFSDAAEMLGSEKRVTFPGDGFQGVKQLCINCRLSSVTFESGTLPMVRVLELKFQMGFPDESSGVSGIEHLSKLKHVLVEFVQQDAGAMSTIDAVRKGTDTFRPNCPEVTIKVDGMSQ